MIDGKQIENKTPFGIRIGFVFDPVVLLKSTSREYNADTFQVGQGSRLQGMLDGSCLLWLL